MEKGASYRECIRELSVLVPVYGKISVDIRTMKGDTPLIFQSMNNGGESNLEMITENSQLDRLDTEDKLMLREKELKIKKGIFFFYQALTIGYGSYLIAQNFF